MKNTIRSCLSIAAVAAATVLGAAPASAVVLLYELRGSQPDDYSATFEFDTDMMATNALSSSIRYNGLSIDFTRPNSSVLENATFANTGVTFRTLQNQGGLFLGFLGGFPSGFQVFGPQLFEGPTSNPTFLTGTFGLSDISRQRTTDPLQVNYTLSISEVTGAVPEPGTWALMLFGFGTIGWAMRTRKRKAVFAYS